MTGMAMKFESDATITILPPAPEPSAADEINHRIANSLQLLAAMVSIEARTIADPAALAALDMTRRRIAAIASVHRQLYRAQRPARIDLAVYLDALGADLEEGFDAPAARRHIFVDAVPVSVEAKDATAIGIIVSELVTNACKYAYAPDASGDVWITLRPLARGGYVLAVEDHGGGLAAPALGSGLGGRLIAMMAARIGGQCTYGDAAPGTRVTLSVAPR